MVSLVVQTMKHEILFKLVLGCFMCFLTITNVFWIYHEENNFHTNLVHAEQKINNQNNFLKRNYDISLSNSYEKDIKANPCLNQNFALIYPFMCAFEYPVVL
eukprot:c11083_g1_i1.p1 GENE.c11083_g1_i1~~c11083_g1_i1.p1  ORF type:complete len:111 (+),score=5.13 c11083_g1_i1:28-333(+)